MTQTIFRSFSKLKEHFLTNPESNQYNSVFVISYMSNIITTISYCQPVVSKHQTGAQACGRVGSEKTEAGEGREASSHLLQPEEGLHPGLSSAQTTDQRPFHQRPPSSGSQREVLRWHQGYVFFPQNNEHGIDFSSQVGQTSNISWRWSLTISPMVPNRLYRCFIL